MCSKGKPVLSQQSDPRLTLEVCSEMGGSRNGGGALFSANESAFVI